MSDEIDSPRRDCPWKCEPDRPTCICMASAGKLEMIEDMDEWVNSGADVSLDFWLIEAGWRKAKND